jgi:hypothetical protein
MIHGVASVIAEARENRHRLSRQRAGEADAEKWQPDDDGLREFDGQHRGRLIAGGEDEARGEEDRGDPTEQQRQLRAHRAASTGVDQRRDDDAEDAGGEVGAHPRRGVQRQNHELVDDRAVAAAELGAPQRVIGARDQGARVGGAILI